MDTIDEGKSNRHVAVTSKISSRRPLSQIHSLYLFIYFFPPFEADAFERPELCFSFRHERAQLQESQHLPDKRQTGEHSDGAEAQRQTLPGGSGWQ